MRVDVAKRMTGPITVVHLYETGVSTQWRTQVVEGAWQVVRERTVGTDGTVTFTDSLRVQIPEDQGDVQASLGDWVVRGDWYFAGDAKELREALPEASRRISAIRDLRGGITGISDSITRYASVLVLECR